MSLNSRRWEIGPTTDDVDIGEIENFILCLYQFQILLKSYINIDLISW